MSLNKRKMFAAALAAAACGTFVTVSNANGVRAQVRMSYDVGGDTVDRFVFSDGEDASIKAGSGGTFSAGLLYRPAANNFAFEAIFGYKFDKLNGSNGTAEFTRFPLDLIGSYVTGDHRVGGGIAYHMNPKYRCAVGGVCSFTAQFSDAMGLVLQYGYTFGGGLDLGVRYTSIKYKLEGGGVSLNGNAFGGFIGFIF
jgi:hypothetical protein